MRSMTRNLTEGNTALTLLKFAFPLFISNALQAAYNLVDMIIVGQFIGGAGLAAVSNGGDILHFLTFVAIGFSSAGQVLIAKNVGAENSREVNNLIGTMFSFLLGISVVISVVCFTLRTQILHALNTPPEAYDYTMSYMVTCAAGLLFIYGYNIVSAILRGMGDSRRPFVFIAIAAILNTVLDYVFVVFCNMEVFGAALATVIGQGVSFIASLVYLFINRESFGFDFRAKSFCIQRNTLKSLVGLGIPMAIQSAAVSFSKIVLLAWINLEGVVFSALAGIYNKINTMAGVISTSFTTAGSSMTGQSLGAGKKEKVPGITFWVLVFSTLLFTVASVFMAMNPSEVYRMFTNDSAVVSVSYILTVPVILNFYGSATRSGAFSLINGSGNTKLNLAVALLDGIIARIGLSALFFFVFDMGSYGCWMGDALAGFIPLVIGTVFFIWGSWRKN